jgi:hypothetical protein
MSAYYWICWAVLTAVNVAAFAYWYRKMRTFAGFDGYVIYKGRGYTIVEQSWDFDSDVLSIRGEAR